jgi:hypothetical protein
MHERVAACEDRDRLSWAGCSKRDCMFADCDTVTRRGDHLTDPPTTDTRRPRCGPSCPVGAAVFSYRGKAHGLFFSQTCRICGSRAAGPSAGHIVHATQRAVPPAPRPWLLPVRQADAKDPPKIFFSVFRPLTRRPSSSSPSSQFSAPQLERPARYCRRQRSSQLTAAAVPASQRTARARWKARGPQTSRTVGANRTDPARSSRIAIHRRRGSPGSSSGSIST